MQTRRAPSGLRYGVRFYEIWQTCRSFGQKRALIRAYREMIHERYRAFH